MDGDRSWSAVMWFPLNSLRLSEQKVAIMARCSPGDKWDWYYNEDPHLWGKIIKGQTAVRWDVVDSGVDRWPPLIMKRDNLSLRLYGGAARKLWALFEYEVAVLQKWHFYPDAYSSPAHGSFMELPGVMIQMGSVHLNTVLLKRLE